MREQEKDRVLGKKIEELVKLVRVIPTDCHVQSLDNLSWLPTERQDGQASQYEQAGTRGR